jgi:hypothetical protein
MSNLNLTPMRAIPLPRPQRKRAANLPAMERELRQGGCIRENEARCQRKRAPANALHRSRCRSLG